jgi:hypothetical protein
MVFLLHTTANDDLRSGPRIGASVGTMSGDMPGFVNTPCVPPLAGLA